MAVDVTVLCPLGPTGVTGNASDVPSPILAIFEVLNPDRRFPNLSRDSMVNPVPTPTIALESHFGPSPSTSVGLMSCSSQ